MLLRTNSKAPTQIETWEKYRSLCRHEPNNAARKLEAAQGELQQLLADLKVLKKHRGKAAKQAIAGVKAAIAEKQSTIDKLQKTAQMEMVPESKEAIALRNAIATENYGLCLKIGGRYGNWCKEPVDDLIGIGFLGLLKAINRYDPSTGNRFSSLAGTWIRGEILHYLRDNAADIRLPRLWSDLASKAQSWVRSQRKDNPKFKATDEAIAAYLNIPVDEWRDISIAIANKTAASLDMQCGGDEDGGALHELLPSLPTEEELNEAQKAIGRKLARLNKRLRTCLQYKIFMGLSSQAIAAKLKLSAEQVETLLAEGLEKLRVTA